MTDNSNLAIHGVGLAKNYGDFRAVSKLDLQVSKGHCFGLLGPNGAGKSTLIRILYGASKLSDGKLSVLGHNPWLEGRSLRKKIGVVPQKNALDEALTVEQNLQVFASYHLLKKKEAQPKIDELLDFLQLSHKRASRIYELSGGMQRRLAFARALLNDPDLIILDEPTTGLDPAVRQLMWDKISELRASGKTILLTTHYMDEAELLCDQLIIMDGGHIKASGSPRELISKNLKTYFAKTKPNHAQLTIPNIVVENAKALGIDAQYHESQGSWHFLGEDFDSLSHFVAKKGLEISQLRPSNLEDVFLKVTGRELQYDA